MAKGAGVCAHIGGRRDGFAQGVCFTRGSNGGYHRILAGKVRAQQHASGHLGDQPVGGLIDWDVSAQRAGLQGSG